MPSSYVSANGWGPQYQGKTELVNDFLKESVSGNGQKGVALCQGK